ncbi:hypothetical protein U1Q18_050033 [Sarracenia purpurea var. burkii]
MEILCQAIVKTVAETSQSKVQKALNADKNDSLHLIVESCKVASNLDVDVKHAVKLNQILSTLQQVCQSSVALTSKEVGDKNLMHLLNMALECDSNTDLLNTLGNALEDVIKQDNAGKLSAIDTLHKVSVKLATKVRDKKPNKVLLLRNVIKGNIEEKSEVVDKLMAVLNDYDTTISVAFQQMCQQNPDFVDIVLEKAADMLEGVLDTKDENKAMENSSVLGEQALRGNESGDLKLLIKSCELVNNLDVDALQSVKLNQILSTIKQVCQSGVALSSREVGDKNLMHLLNMALECDPNANLLDTLGTALEDVIKHDKAGKLNAIDALHTVSVKLATKVRNKKPNKVLLLKNVIKGNVVEKKDVVDKLMTVLNDCEGEVSIAFQQMCKQNPEFVNKVLENVTAMLENIEV